MSKRRSFDDLVNDFRFHKNPILNWVLAQANYYSHTYMNFKWNLKNKLQRIFRGYSDSDCWNLPQATARFLLPRIKHLRKKYNSLSNRHHLLDAQGEIVPYEAKKSDVKYSEEHKDYIDTLINKPLSLSEKEYEFILDEIVFAFELLLQEDTLELDRIYEVYPKDFDPIKDRKMFLTEQEDGNSLVEFETKDNIQPDYSKLNKAYERQKNGLMLFGLYFKDLWD